MIHVMFSVASRDWGAYVEHFQASVLWSPQESLAHLGVLVLEARPWASGSSRTS